MAKKRLTLSEIVIAPQKPFLKEKEAELSSKINRPTQTKLHHASALRSRKASFIKSTKKFETLVARSTPLSKQCKTLMAKFGGLLPLCIAAETSFRNVLEWNTKGYGLIPVPYLIRLAKNARAFGVLLRAKDIYPDFIDYDTLRVRQNTDMQAWDKAIKTSIRKRDAEFQDQVASLAGKPK